MTVVEVVIMILLLVVISMQVVMVWLLSGATQRATETTDQVRARIDSLHMARKTQTAAEQAHIYGHNTYTLVREIHAATAKSPK